MNLKDNIPRVPLAAWLVLWVAATWLHGENWPQWRGPLLNGSTTETNLKDRFSKQEDLQWSTPMPGRSGATPVVWGDAIFVPSADAQKNLVLLCVDRATGKVRWQRVVGTGDRVSGKNNMASCSAVTDGRRVYALFGTSDFAAFGFDGTPVWKIRLREQFGAFANMFLYGASPLLFEDRLYVPLLQRNPPTYGHAMDQMPERKSWLICIDPATGKVLWNHERKTDAREEAMEAYTTPMPFAGSKGTEIVLVGADCVTAHRPDDGAEVWRYAGLNRSKNPGGRIVPSVVTTPGFVFAIGPKREQLAALRGGGSGLVGEEGVAWRTETNIPDVPTPLFYQGHLFVLDGDRQTLTCFQPDNGQKIWQGRLGIREIFYASPTGADGKIYCLSEDGTLVVLSAGAKHEVFSTTAFGEGPCMSSVVVSDGCLLIRTAENLHCLRASK
jgi:outer membrane protein assembly factor BamB